MSMEQFEKAQGHIEELRGLSLDKACQANPLSPKIQNGQSVIPPAINQVLIQLTEQQEATLKLLTELESRIATILVPHKDTPRLREIDTGGLLRGRQVEQYKDALPSSTLVRGLFVEISQRVQHQRDINQQVKTLAERVEL